MNFFPKIPEIDLRRLSLQFSFEVVVAIHEKLEKFQNLQYLEKRSQCDNGVYSNKWRNNEAFSWYASYHWVFCLRRNICIIPNGYPCNALVFCKNFFRVSTIAVTNDNNKFYKRLFHYLRGRNLQIHKKDFKSSNCRTSIVNDHTMLKTPVLVRSPKLSNIGRC
jgi:hypothetical protein